MLNLSREIIKIAAIMLLTSCLTINSDLEINKNGGGSLKMVYSLDKGLNDISNLEDEDNIVPLNLSENYIKEVIAGREDISYRDYHITYEKDLYNISVTFDFDTIEGLNSILPDDNRITIENSGDSTIFTQIIVKSAEDEITEDSAKIFKDIFKEHTFSLRVKTPEEIKDVSNGSIVSKRVAIYSESFIDIVTDPEKKLWTIRW